MERKGARRQVGDACRGHRERGRSWALAPGVLPWRHSQAPAPKGESTLSQGGRTSSVNKHHSPCLHGASSKASLAVPGAGPAKRLCTVRGLAKKRGLQFET